MVVWCGVPSWISSSVSNAMWKMMESLNLAGLFLTMMFCRFRRLMKVCVCYGDRIRVLVVYACGYVATLYIVNFRFNFCTIFAG